MKCANAPACAMNARQVVHSGVVILVLCTPCWRAMLERLVDAAGLRVRTIEPGTA